MPSKYKGVANPAKKRKISHVEEIAFDHAAREDYLTGFHKRKQARIKHAQAESKRKERERHIKERKELRDRRKQEVEDHVRAVNEALRKARTADASDSEDETDYDEFAGIEAEDQEKGEQDQLNGLIESQWEEYIDEDKFTMVTVEPFELDDGGETEVTSTQLENHDANGQVKAAINQPIAKGKVKEAKPKKKRKNFRYESKAERKEERSRQKGKNSAAARARRAQS